MHRLASREPYRWLTPVILMVAIVVLATGALSILYVEGHLIATTGESLALAATDIADMLDRILFERYSETLILSQASVFQGRDRKAMTELLAQLKQTYPVYLWLGVTDANGRIIAATNPASVGQNRGVRDWFTAVRKLGTVQVRDAEASEDTGGTLAVAFTAPVKNPKGEFLGVVTTHVGIPPLVDIFEKVVRGFQAQRGSPGKIEYQFLTRDGDVIADSLLRQEGQVNLKRLGLPSALLIDSAQPGYVEERHLRRGVDVISGYAQTRGYGGFAGLRWGILMRMDRSDVLTPMRKVLWRLTAAGALIMLPLLGFLLWTTGRLRTEWMHAKEAEGALRESEVRFRSLIEAIPQQVWTALPDGALDYVNQRVVAYFGRTFEQMIGWGWQDVLHPDDLPECLTRWARARERGEPYEIEFRLRRGSDGAYLWHIGRALPLRDKEGRIVKWFGTNTDITELKQAEQSLRESEAKFRDLVEHTNDLFWEVDRNGVYTYCSPTVTSILGYEPAELIGKTPFDLMPPEEAKRVGTLFGAIVAEQKPFALLAHTIRRKDGSLGTMECSGTPVFDSQGQFTGYRGVDRDITERKRAEDALERLRRQNELILNSAGEGIYGLDLQGNATFVNPAAARMVGWEIEDLLGKPMHAILHHSKSDGTPYPEEECPIYAAFRYGTVQYLDTEVFWKKDGTSFPVEYISTPLRERNKIVGAVVTFQDIAERKREAEIRTRLLERVIAAQEEERRRIARELHDETGQALTALLVGLRTMEGARTIKEAQALAHELRRIAAQTLDEVGRLAKGLHPSVLDDLGLVAALERYAADFAKSRAIAIKVLTKGLEASRLPLAVETALYRIVQEALTNIAKHATAKTVEVSIEAHPSCVWATVKDDGRGFDLDEARRTSGVSAHLGIHGMQERAALLKGSIQIESLPRSGTTISVRIPLTGNTNG